MKKIYNYTFQLVCIYVVVLTLFSIFNFDITKPNYNKKVSKANEEKALDSTLLVQNLEKDKVEEESVEEKKEEPVKEEITTHEQQQNTVPVSQEVESQGPNIQDLSGYTSLASETVTISRYGADCAGCDGGQTSAGYYVGNGRIYYSDNTYGDLRIVAADKKYPLGTVMRITYNGNSFGVIVLDRGGGIGDHARFQLDLLERTESEANSSYIMYNALLEVLRYGY